MRGKAKILLSKKDKKTLLFFFFDSLSCWKQEMSRDLERIAGYRHNADDLKMPMKIYTIRLN